MEYVDYSNRNANPFPLTADLSKAMKVTFSYTPGSDTPINLQIIGAIAANSQDAGFGTGAGNSDDAVNTLSSSSTK